MQHNIWALEKDLSIKHLLLLLVDTFGKGQLDLPAPTEGHPCSILLSSQNDDNVYAYIYTYGQRPEHYGVHLEYPSQADSRRFDTTEILEDISYERLVEILSVHLGIFGAGA